MKHQYEQIYSQLGNLFYSIAAVDREVSPKEVKELQNAVKKYWLEFEESTDAFGTDAAYYINMAFDYLEETVPDANDAWEEFEAFFKEHPMWFSLQMKDKILKTAENIVNASAGANKSELIGLTKLAMLFGR